MNQTSTNQTTAFDPCLLHRCYNNGQCFIKDYHNEQAGCRCAPEFTGEHCDLPVAETFICTQLGLCKPFGPYIFGVGITTFLCSAVILVYFALQCCYSWCRPIEPPEPLIVSKPIELETNETLGSHPSTNNGGQIPQQFGRRFVPVQTKPIPIVHSSPSRACSQAINRRQKRQLAAEYRMTRPAKLTRNLDNRVNQGSDFMQLSALTGLTRVRTVLPHRSAIRHQKKFTTSQSRRTCKSPLPVPPSEKPYSNESSSATDTGSMHAPNHTQTKAFYSSAEYTTMQPSVSYENNNSGEFHLSNLSYCSETVSKVCATDDEIRLHAPKNLSSPYPNSQFSPQIPCTHTASFRAKVPACTRGFYEPSDKIVYPVLLNQQSTRRQQCICSYQVNHQWITLSPVYGFAQPFISHVRSNATDDVYENFAYL